jgi:hypothetical protein
MAERQPLVQKTTPHHQPTASPRGQSPIESLSSDPPPPGYQYAAIDPRTINVAEIRPNPIPVSYGEVPCSVICPVCHKQVTTSISYKAVDFASFHCASKAARMLYMYVLSAKQRLESIGTLRTFYCS